MRTLFVLCTLQSLLPDLLQRITVGRSRVSLDNAFALAPVPKALSTMLTWAILLVLTYGATWSFSTRHRTMSSALWVFLLPWLAEAISTIHHGILPGKGYLFYPLIGLLFALERPSLQALLPLGYMTGAVALVSLLLGALRPDLGTMGPIGNEDKSLLPLPLLAGPYDHSNVLGIILALGSPWVLLIPRRATRMFFLICTLAALLLSASRTSLAGTGAALVVALVTPHISRSRLATKFFVSTVACFGLALVVGVPLMTQDPEAFSERSKIWAGSLALWRAHPWFGIGPAGYGDISGSTNDLGNLAFNGHNWFIHALTTTGVVGIALLLIFMTALIRFAGATDSPVVFAALVAIIFSGTLELPVEFSDLGPRGYAAFFLLAVVPFTRSGRPLDSEVISTVSVSRDVP